MAKFSRVAGATSQSVNVFVQDSSSTTGAGLGAIAPAGGSLLAGTVLYYSFSGANATSVVVSLSVLAAVNSAYSSGGIVQIDNTNMKGTVRIDLPNASLAASKGNTVTFYLSGGTNMAPCVFEIELTGTDNQDGVHGGMSALPNTACTTNASLITSGSGTDQLTVSGGLGYADAKKINAVSTASVTAVNANVGTTQPMNFTGTGASAKVQSDVITIGGITQTAGDVVNSALSALQYSQRATIRGTVGSASTTTSVVTSALDISGSNANQLNGRVLIFDKTTATAQLQGQGGVISAITVSATPTITIPALTTAPQSGDQFTIY